MRLANDVLMELLEELRSIYILCCVLVIFLSFSCEFDVRFDNKVQLLFKGRMLLVSWTLLAFQISHLIQSLGDMMVMFMNIL